MINYEDDVDDEVEEFLEHFGIKGMHWGVRNKQQSQHFKRTFEENRALRRKRVRKEALKAGIKGAVIASVLGSLFVAANVKLAHPMKIRDMHLSGETAKTAADFIRAEHA